MFDEKKDKQKKLEDRKTTIDNENEQLAQSLGLEVSDFCDDGADLDELRDIVDGNV